MNLKQKISHFKFSICKTRYPIFDFQNKVSQKRSVSKPQLFVVFPISDSRYLGCRKLGFKFFFKYFSAFPIAISNFQFPKHNSQFTKTDIRNRKVEFLLRVFSLFTISYFRYFRYWTTQTQVFVQMIFSLPDSPWNSKTMFEILTFDFFLCQIL